MTLDDLKKPIPNETQKQFEKRVEAVYCYTLQPGEVWTLFGDALIVAHPDRAPIWVAASGKIEEIKPARSFTLSDDGALREEPVMIDQKQQIFSLNVRPDDA